MNKPIIVFGATSFVGQILCRYLHELNHDGTLNWLMAARSEEKLKRLQLELGGPHVPGYRLADAANETQLRALCDEAGVIISTVGPYALYGGALVKVCAETGTDYCDLAGETQWIRRMIDRYETKARESGARIVHCCGFDSIPSDLGVWFLQQQAQQQLGTHCWHVKMRVRKFKGGFSGGTVASMMNVAKEAVSDPALRRELADPYSLCPPDSKPEVRQPKITAAMDDDVDSWIAPFVMEAINTRVVHRSNALLRHPWGQDFLYDEAVMTGADSYGYKDKGELRARLTAFGQPLTMLGLALPPTRWLMSQFLPKPGEGPSPEMQQTGFFDLVFVGRTSDGRTVRTTLYGERDPGYGATARMLGQAALCLRDDVSKEDRPGGFWTPASALAEPLIVRLEKDAGLSFKIAESN
ncbi:MAG: saccharopine dehydrogenase NADP-binding domain-containing protein [Pseudohongiella sp.]|nr:saccharopine dehydrogenase NADP-binding domain-containing protein [Pseudohongiella sp.]MDP2126411.1 saccharopine dehydrogenase NADP-binding domain-containing protein [Pseudohongiella sp.]